MKRQPVERDLKRVLVIVDGGVGDLASATAPLAAIRAHHASAEITVLTRARHLRFFQRCPYVDRIDVRWRARRLVNAVEVAWSRRREGYGMVYDLVNSLETEAMFKALRPFPPRWCGVAPGCSHPHADRGRARLHVLDRHAEQLWIAGIGPEEGHAPGAAPLADLGWLESDPAEAARHEPARQGIVGPFALIAPEGPPDAPAKRWPAARYAQLAHALADRGLRPVLVGSPAALAMAADLRAAAPEVLDLVGRLDTFQVLGLARRAALAFGSEGDLSTAFAAVGAPTVALINPNETNPRKAAPRGRATVALVARRFQDISVEQVLAAARAVEAAGPVVVERAAA